MKVLQQRCDLSLCSRAPEFTAASSSCQVSASKQMEFSQLVTDVAWSLKKPVLEAMQPLMSMQIKRINNLLNFLIKNGSTAILKRILSHVETTICHNMGTEMANADMELLHMNMDNAKDVICQKLQRKGYPVGHLSSVIQGGGSFCQNHQNVPSMSQVRAQHPVLEILT